MLRYKQLLLKSLDPDNKTPRTMRELARELKIPVPSLHNYVQFDTLPRIQNIQKMANYYNETVSSLFSEDTDTTATLIDTIRKLPPSKQKQILKQLKSK